MAEECQVAAQHQLDLDGNKMEENKTANNEIIRWENGDETTVNNGLLLLIKNPTTSPETEAEEL